MTALGSLKSKISKLESEMDTYQITKLEETIGKIIKILAEKEARMDRVIQLNRAIVRDCARAIKHVHNEEVKECEKIVESLEPKMKSLTRDAEGFEGIASSCWQEYTEVKCLLAIVQKKEMPDYEELGVPYLEYLTGLCDCTGELRRLMQTSLMNGKKKDAEYYFAKMNEIYDNVMTIKYSGSLIGSLKRKQDVARSQVEQARSEMLRHA
ncbi:MAG: hypothetical protein V1881_02025 [Candidatus Micrarchaeota archaeon]